MKWLTNLFKKEEETKQAEPKKATWVNTMSGRDYLVEDFSTVKVQSVDNDIRPYGWVIEMKWKKYNSHWTTYYTNKIYNSNSSAMSALICIKNLWNNNKEYDFRITAIYAMDQNFYRNYKINQLVDENQSPVKKYELKAWKANQDNDTYKLKKDRTVFIQLENGRIIRAGGPTDSTMEGSRKLLFDELMPKGMVQETELKDEKWLYPHLLKELKVKIK